MKIIRLFSVMFVITIIIHSCKKSCSDRNKLIFKDKIENVQDSLSKIELFLSMLPKRNDNENTYYCIENGRLSINDNLIDVNFITSVSMSNIYTQAQKKEFIELSDYLNKNFLSCAYFDEFDKLWRFIYKDFSKRGFNDTRDVCVFDNSKTVSLSNDTVLDRSNKLYLLAPKGAIIR